MRVAQTNIQLYNQLRERGSPLSDLLLVHRAYELLTALYSGCFYPDGRPFVAHAVGVASILAELGQPAEVLALGLLHNVYGNGDFGDGRGPGATLARRRVVREAVGEQVEELVARFRDVGIQWKPIADVRRTLPERDEAERLLILVDLADFLEKYVDFGALYFTEGAIYGRDYVERAIYGSGPELVEIASELGGSRLSEMLSSALAAAAAALDEIPPELQPADRPPLVVPRSCRRRLRVRLVLAIREVRSRARLRTRLRRGWAL
jgi:hypothetical protein